MKEFKEYNEGIEQRKELESGNEPCMNSNCEHWDGQVQNCINVGGIAVDITTCKKYSTDKLESMGISSDCEEMKNIIKLSKHEIQSGLTRVGNAEGLIEQLPETHDGRNTWLMNYGTRDIAKTIRANDAQRYSDAGYKPRVLTWNNETECLNSAH